jgi:hypothetical protein
MTEGQKNLKRIRELTKETRAPYKLTWDFAIEPEEIPVRGNALASGDAVLDRETEDKIIARLDRGDVIAWCCAVVMVRVEVGGDTFTGTATLGCCSYETDAELRRDCMEHYDLKSEALADLHIKLDGAIKRGNAAASLKSWIPVKL